MTTQDSEYNDWRTNRAATFLPGGTTRGDDTLPCIEIAGAQVYAYVRDGILRVSVDLDTVSASDYWPEGREYTPLHIAVQGETVWEADPEGNYSGQRSTGRAG